jgi:hypothetical protein
MWAGWLGKLDLSLAQLSPSLFSSFRIDQQLLVMMDCCMYKVIRILSLYTVIIIGRLQVLLIFSNIYFSPVLLDTNILLGTEDLRQEGRRIFDMRGQVLGWMGHKESRKVHFIPLLDHHSRQTSTPATK